MHDWILDHCLIYVYTQVMFFTLGEVDVILSTTMVVPTLEVKGMTTLDSIKVRTLMNS